MIQRVAPALGDTLIGLASSGAHSNGYSLIRKVIEISGVSLDSPFENTTLGRALLEPTRIYAKLVLQLIERYQHKLHGLAHITGGGLTENLPRVLPEYTHAQVQLQSWTRPRIFQWLQQHGHITEPEMLRTFNCGIGMVLVVAPEYADEILATCQTAGYDGWRMGELVASAEAEPKVHYV